MDDRPAAGQRVSTADQNSRQNKTFQSSIFNNEPAGPTPQPPRKQYSASHIFGGEPQTVAAGKQGKTNNSFKSSIFDQPIVQPVGRTSVSNQSTIFNAGANEEVRPAKNNESKQQDHGKEYLFGTQFNNDHRAAIKKVKTQEKFEPKLNYDADSRKFNDLYNNEMGREHLPVKKTEKALGNRCPSANNTTDLDASQRRQQDNASNIFGTKTNQIQQRLQNQLNTKVSTKPVRKVNQDITDPTLFAKAKKGQEQQSAYFEVPERVSTQVQQPSDPQFDKLKVRNPNLSEVFGLPQQEFVNYEKRDKLLASDVDHYKLDSVKHLKDLAPDKDHQTISDQADQLNNQQKLFSTLKSSLDQHGYDYTEYTERTQRISNKSQKYKADIIQQNQKQATTKQKSSSQVKSKPAKMSKKASQLSII